MLNALYFIGIIWLFFFTEPDVRDLILEDPDCTTLEEKYNISLADCESTKGAIAYMRFIYFGTSIEMMTLVSAYIFLYNQLSLPINTQNKDFFIMLRGNNVEIKEISRKRDTIKFKRGLYFLTKALSDNKYNRYYVFVENLNQPIYDLKRDTYKLNKILYFEDVMVSKLKTKRVGILRLQHIKNRIYQMVIDLDNEKVIFQPLSKNETPVGKLFKYSKLVKVYIYIKRDKKEEENMEDMPVDSSIYGKYESYLLQYAMGDISLQQLKQIQNLELIYRFNLNPFYTFDLVKKVKNLKTNFVVMLSGKAQFPMWLLLLGAVMMVVIFLFMNPVGTTSPTTPTTP